MSPWEFKFTLQSEHEKSSHAWLIRLRWQWCSLNLFLEPEAPRSDAPKIHPSVVEFPSPTCIPGSMSNSQVSAACQSTILWGCVGTFGQATSDSLRQRLFMRTSLFSDFLILQLNCRKCSCKKTRGDKACKCHLPRLVSPLRLSGTVTAELADLSNQCVSNGSWDVRAHREQLLISKAHNERSFQIRQNIQW